MLKVALTMASVFSGPSLFPARFWNLATRSSRASGFSGSPFLKKFSCATDVPSFRNTSTFVGRHEGKRRSYSGSTTISTLLASSRITGLARASGPRLSKSTLPETSAVAKQKGR